MLKSPISRHSTTFRDDKLLAGPGDPGGPGVPGGSGGPSSLGGPSDLGGQNGKGD